MNFLKRGDVLVNGDPVRARQVANQVALRDAIEKYGVSKVFTFHKTVDSAASFVADGHEGVRTLLPDFQTFHVNRTMPTARRERQMRDFDDAKFRKRVEIRGPNFSLQAIRNAITTECEWAQLFVETWNYPPRFTNMHRPGIARIQGDRGILDGTTVDEIEKHHRETLKVVCRGPSE